LFSKSEFEKRAGLVIIAAYCMADENAGNEVFVGKRNIGLNNAAIIVANRISMLESKSAKWAVIQNFHE